MPIRLFQTPIANLYLGTTPVDKVYMGGTQVWPEMTGLWHSRSVLAGSSVDANGTASHTCTFAPATSGHRLVAIVAGAVASSTPAGWSLVVSAVQLTGLYVFTKIATGGESSFTTTHNSANYAIRGVVYELPASATVLGSNSQLLAGGGAVSGPAMTGLTGTYAVFAARSHGLTLPSGSIEASWTAPTIEDYEEFVGSNGNDGIGLSVAVQSGVSGDSFSCVYNMMWDNTAIDVGESAVVAISV